MCIYGAFCKHVVDPSGASPCYTVDVKCCDSREYCEEVGELGSECRSGTCYDHCLFACGYCEDGSC
jgi:hypothetical protein